jgi:fructan beta-fructosidase
VLDTCQAGCDSAQGTLTSPVFTISTNYIDFLIAGGNHPASAGHPTTVNLVVDGQVVASATGNNSPNLDWATLDATKYQGKQATLQIVDQNDGSTGWGHFMVDDIIFSDVKAAPWDAQSGANLLVDGKIVRTATGNDSSSLDWASWDLSDLQGKQAQTSWWTETPVAGDMSWLTSSPLPTRRRPALCSERIGSIRARTSTLRSPTTTPPTDAGSWWVG